MSRSSVMHDSKDTDNSSYSVSNSNHLFPLEHSNGQKKIKNATVSVTCERTAVCLVIQPDVRN